MDKDRIIPIIVVLIILMSSFTYYYYCNKKGNKNKTIEPQNCSTVDVVFDRSYWHLWSIWDTGSFGYSTAANLLRDNGCNVSQNTMPLRKRVQQMGDEDVLVLGAAPNSTSNYSDKDEQVILDFVDRGGNILVIGEHDDAYGIATRQNKILRNFGIRVLPDMIDNKEENIGTKDWVELTSNKFGMKHIGVWGAGPLKLSGNAETLAYMNTSDNTSGGENYTVSAASEYGKGKVAAVGDANIFWNGKYNWGIEYGENKKYLLRLVEYLAGRRLNEEVLEPEFKLFTDNNCQLTLKNPKENKVTVNIEGGNIQRVEGKKTSKEIIYSVNVSNDGYIKFSTAYSAPVYVHFLSPPDHKNLDKKVLFDLSHGARGVSPSPSGLYRFASYLRDRGFEVTAKSDPDYSSYDAVIISNPLEKYSETELNTISQSSVKMVLMGENYFSLKNEDLGLYAYIIHSFEGWSANPSPIDQIGRKRGVGFSWYSVVDKESGLYPEVTYDENHTLSLFESPSLTPSSSFTVKETRGDKYGEGVNYMPWEMEQNKDDKSGPIPYAAWNENTFAFSDTSPLENQRFQDNSWLADEISRWIE